MELDFLDTFLENIQRSFFMNIRPVEASCSMRADGQTDGRTDSHDKNNSRFSQFC
jgi:hypothetical protein